MNQGVTGYVLNRVPKGIFGGLTVAVDGTFGSDAGGQRGGRAFQTLTAAKNAAQSGDTIIVYPGTYNENNLLKDGVNWYFYSGAVVHYVNTNVASGGGTVYGIFDDRAGAVSCRVDGDGEFYMEGGTAVADADAIFNTGVATYLAVNNTIKGVVTITNVNTNFTLKCSSIRNLAYFDGYQFFSVYVTNCARCEITADRIMDDVTVLSVDLGSYPVDGDVPIDVTASVANGGVYWEHGEMYVNARHIRANYYPVYCSDVLHTASNFWLNADLIEQSYLGGVTTVYLLGYGPNTTFRSYINCKEIRGYDYHQDCYGVYSGGKHYLNAQKITAGVDGTNSPKAVMTSQAGTSDAPNMWVTAQKVIGAVNVASKNGSVIVLDIMQFGEEDGSTAMPASAFDIDVNGTGTGGVHIRGGHMRGGKLRTGAGGGAVHVQNLRIDCAGIASTPVTVLGAGLVLQNVVLVAGSATNSVTAAAAQTITSYGVKANKAKHANVTVNVDAITVDANVV